MDQKRLVGDVGAATRLRASLEPIGGEPETDLALGAVEMLSADVSSWTGILDRLERATAGEKQAGRARALFVYALVRARDAKRARAQLDELAKLKRPHPVEAALRRFVERVEKGDKIAFRLADLPSPDAKTPSVDVAGPLKAAEDALAKRDTKKAEALFQQVLSADEHNPDALVGLAQIAKQNGNGKQAAALLERAVDKNPDHARALLALADARWDASDSPGAKSLYKRALDAGLTGAGADRAKQRTAATSATGTAEPTPTATVDPTPTATTPPPTTGGGVEPPPFGQDPPPFGQDPPPPPPPKPPDTSQPPGAPL
jgi:thioredoxin-like negative regulator of GroEL